MKRFFNSWLWLTFLIVVAVMSIFSGKVHALLTHSESEIDAIHLAIDPDGDGTFEGLDLQWTAIAPNDWADATRDLFFIWSNDTGLTRTITRIISWSDTDDTAYNIYECTDWNMSSCSSIQSITISTNGTVGYYNTVTGLSIAIETGHILYIDFDNTDTPGQVKGKIDF